MANVWLITVGSALLAVAAGLWMLRSRLQEVTTTINKGFQIVEDSIKVNLLNPNEALDKTRDTITQVADILDQVKLGILDGKKIIVNDVVPGVNTVAVTIKGDVKPILKESSNVIATVHNTVDIGIADGVHMNDLDITTLRLSYWHPFKNFADSLQTIALKLWDLGDKTENLATIIDDAANKIGNVGQSIDGVGNNVQNISNNIRSVVPFIDEDLRKGFQDTVNLLAQTRTNLSQVLGFISPRLIAALVAAGGLFIAAGSAAP